ncbi:hypothetical protein QEN19_001640 [Hanseniaspora menglaensis]
MSNSLTPLNTASSFDKDHAYLFGNEFEIDIQDPQSEIESSDSVHSNSMNIVDSNAEHEVNRTTIKRSVSGSGFDGDVSGAFASDSDDEDNNPFKGSSHKYANGLHNSLNHSFVALARDNSIPDQSSIINKPSRQLKSTNHATSLPNSISYIQMPSITNEEEELLGIANAPKLVQENENEINCEDTLKRYTYIKDEEYLINIVYAGKFQFSDGKIAIGYTILYKGAQVTRRYTDFVKLRQTLKKLLPTCIIPPIPDRHSLISYILQPFQFTLNYNRTNGSKRLIDESHETLLRRSRQFQKFLNICFSKEKIKNCSTFLKFIDADFANWRKVMSQPPVTILPETNLLAPPLDPVKPSPLHLLLPVPKHMPSLSEEDKQLMSWLTEYNKTYIHPNLRVFNNFKTHVDSSIDYIAELGGLYNISSIETQIFTINQTLTEQEYDSQDISMNSSFGSFVDKSHATENGCALDDELSTLFEKIGQIYDSNYISTQFLINDLNISFKESLEMLAKFNEESLVLINFKTLKKEQNNIIVSNLKILQDRYNLLENMKHIDNSNKEVAENEELQVDDLESFTVHNSAESEAALNGLNDGDISVESIIENRSKNDYVESILLKNKGHSKAIQAAIKQYSIQKKKAAYKNLIKDLPKKHTLEISESVNNAKCPKTTVISREKINEELDELTKKLNNVKILKEVSDRDLSEIYKDFDSELDFEKRLYEKVWSNEIIKNISTSIATWSSENLTQWESIITEFSSEA